MDDHQLLLSDLIILQFLPSGCVWACVSPVAVLRAVEAAAAAGVCRLMVASGQWRSGVSRGDLCLVERSRGQWCRARVTNMLKSLFHGTVAELLLIDRGEVASRPLSELIPIPQCDHDDVLLTPPLAQQYTLAGITPVHNQSSWATNVIRCVCDNGGTMVDDFGVHVLANDVGTNELVLYSITAGEGMVNINELLVDAGLYSEATPTERIGDSCVDMSSQKEATSRRVFSNDDMAQLQFLESHPLSYKAVFVETEKKLNPICALASPPFPSSLCKMLKDRGFRRPTAVQAHGWPYLIERRNCFMVSPHDSGKTLAFLLPLISLVVQQDDPSYEPNLVIMVSTCFKAWLVCRQVEILLSSCSADKRFRCCAVYNGVESCAVQQLMNGVDVAVVTPPSLLRMMKKKFFSLDKLYHLVLDDAEVLVDIFSSDVAVVLNQYHAVVSERRKKGLPLGHHIVATTTRCTGSLLAAVDILLPNDVVRIVNGSDELLIMKKVSLQAHYVSEDQVLNTATTLAVLTEEGQQTEPLLVCAGSRENAVALVGLLKLRCVRAEFSYSRAHLARITVLCDDDLSQFLPCSRQYTTVIHCSLPADKSVFSQRMAMLHKSITDGHKCRVVLLITDSNRGQCVWLLHLLDRMKLECPSIVRHQAQCKLTESHHVHPELCPQLKTSGRCRSDDQCLYAHNFQQLRSCDSLPQLQMPASGVVKVRVHYVSSPSQLWASIVDYIPLAVGDAPLAGLTNEHSVSGQLGLDMAMHYSQPIQHCLQHKPNIGDYCAVMDSNGCYHRVLVLAFSQPLGLYFHHHEEARVRFIDTGEMKIVKVSQLCNLPNHLLSLAAQVVEVIVCGMSPCDQDNDWPPRAVELSRQMMAGKILTGRIALVVQQTMWLDPVEERLELNYMGISTGVRSIQQHFVKAELAVRNLTHLSDLAVQLRVHPPRDVKQPHVNEMKWSDIDGSGSVIVSMFCSPSLFYVQDLSTHDQLHQLNQSMNDSDSSRNCSLLLSLCQPLFATGDVCVARYSKDQLFYRAVICARTDELDGQSYECFLADYGITEQVPRHSVLPVSRLLLKLPFQAIQCSLDDGDKHMNCSNAGVKLSQLKETPFTASVISKKPASEGILPCCHFVDLKTSDGVCMTSFLIAKSDLLPPVQPKASCDSRLRAALSDLTSEHCADPLTTAYVVLNCVLAAPQRVEQSSVGKLLDLLTQASCVSVPVLLRALSILVIFNINLFLASIYQKQFSHIMQQLLQEVEGDTLLRTVELMLLALQHVDEEIIIFDDETVFQRLLHHGAYCSDLQIAAHSIEIVTILVETREMLVVTDLVLACIKRGHSHRQLVSPILKFIYHIILKGFSTDECHHVASMLIPQCSEPEVVELVQSVLHSTESCCQHKLTKQPETHLVSTSVHYSLPTRPTDATGSQPSVPSDSQQSLSSVKCNQLELTPRVLWSQTYTQLLLSVQLRDCRAPHVEYGASAISFVGSVQQSLYSFSIDLFGGIIPKESSIKHSGGEVLVKIKKLYRAFWPRVAKSKAKYAFLSVDYSRWREQSSCSSSEDDELSSIETRRPVVHTDLQGAQAGGTEPAPLSSNDDSSNLSSDDAISDVPD